MLQGMTITSSDIPALFVQLDQLDEFDQACWKEKARWIRYEEQAEDALERWSKPHVATLTQTSLENLKEYLINGKMLFDLIVNDMKQIADVVANELLDYFKDYDSSTRFGQLLCLPHFHHHHQEKNLNDDSFEFKENTKLKSKLHSGAEGASVQVAALDWVTSSKLLFLQLETPAELKGLLEVDIKSKFLVLLVGPIEKRMQLYEVGRAISTCLADDVCRAMFYSAHSKEDIIKVVEYFNLGTMVIPPSEWDPKIRIEPPERFMSREERQKVPELTEYLHEDEAKMIHEHHSDPTLNASSKPFNGIYYDLKRKLPHYLSDFSECLNLQCVATSLYMSLVSLCSLVAFGGMLGKKTDNSMATMECILAGSLCGIFFSLFSGQPLNIISATGPMLILEAIIKQLCDKNKVDFMEFRLWVGLWTALFLFVLVMFNLSFLVKFITRFTEDCFATLVAIIFIIDAFKSTWSLRIPDGFKSISNSNFTNESNLTKTTFSPLAQSESKSTFIFSIILFFLTYFISTSLKNFRHKAYLPSRVREILSDFAVLLAILISSMLDLFVGLKTAKLTIPGEFRPTANRSWFVPLYSGRNEWWTIGVASAPALIATILVFMDQQITAVIVNRKEFKMKKSNGYHLDLFVICLTIVMCSLLGLPWFVAATVLALSHINSLKIQSKNCAPGEKPVFMGVREQRVTSLLMSILVGLSVFLAKHLAYIPMACLYGIFLFMGVNALNGMQLFERILILFMPAKYQPDYKYLRYVSTGRVHLFTLIQIISTAGLYLIKFIDSLAIFFPVLVVATCGIRKLLDYVFTQNELFWLDDILPGTNEHNKHDEKINKLNENKFSSVKIYRGLNTSDDENIKLNIHNEMETYRC